MSLRKYSKNRTKGTDFQKKVWEVVKKIPYGEIRTYQWVANKIGNPKAARAVGNALNKNPFPIIVPCHRVIRKNGRIGGFSKGTKKKEKLLRTEGVIIKNGYRQRIKK